MRFSLSILVLVGICLSDSSRAENDSLLSGASTELPVRRTSAVGGGNQIEHALGRSESLNTAKGRTEAISTAERVEKNDLTGRLKPPVRRKSSPDTATRTAVQSPLGQWMTTLLGLSIVLGLILSFAYAFRKHIPLATKVLPPDIVEVLGRRFIDQRNCVQLIRCGNRILIVAHSPTHGLQTLSEITDAIEVDTLAGRCKQSDTSSMTSRFEELIAGQFRSSREPSAGGEIENSGKEDTASVGLRLSRNHLRGSERRGLPHA